MIDIYSNNCIAVYMKTKMSQDSENLGPLPKADHNAELQRRSIAVFQASLAPDKFVFRDERIDDAGVDGSLEVLVDGQYTNLRSQVQLKSTDSRDRNADGSVSVPVRVANLNYLLNGPSSTTTVVHALPILGRSRAAAILIGS